MSWSVGRKGAICALLIGTLNDRSGALTLEEALRRAFDAHPLLGAAALGVEAAEGRMEQAALGPNPELEVNLENLSGSLPGLGESETSVQLSQRVETGGKRAARRAAAGADRAVVEWDVALARLDLVHDVRREFVAGIAAQQRLALADETLAIAREVAATARKKVEAGALPVVEATRARVAVAAAEMERARAQAVAQEALERLALHWGGGRVPLGIEGELDSLAAVPALDTLIAGLSSNPDLARWEAAADFREARLRLEEGLSTPDLRLLGGYRHLAASGDGTFLFGVSLDLPFRDRNQGAVREAAAELERASLQFEAARRLLTRELREHATRARIAQLEVRALRRNVLPGAQEVFEGVRQGYEQGRFTYLDVLEARRSLAEIRGTEISALSELEQTRIEIERLIGGGVQWSPKMEGSE